MRALIPLFLLLLTGAAGCLTRAPTSELAPPRFGDVAQYTGDDGSRLTLTVQEPATRRDGWLREHATVVLGYEYRFPPHPQVRSVPFRFEEAVSIDGARIVQQVALCGRPGGTNAEITCPDPKAKVMFAATGLPGGLGAGLIWAGTVQRPGAILHTFQAADSTLGAPLSLNATSVSHDGHECLRMASATKTPATDQLLMLPWTVLDGPALFCPALSRSFPVQFQAEQAIGLNSFNSRLPIAYNLTDFRPGTEPVPFRASPPWPHVPVPLTWLAPPYYVGDLRQAPGRGFTMPEAHAQALDLSPDYKRIMGATPSGLVTEFFQKRVRTFDTVVGTSEEVYHARLVALQPDGQGVQVTLAKAVTTAQPGLEGPPTYDLVMVTDVNRPVPAIVPNQVADLGAVVALGQRLNGNLSQPGGNVLLRHHVDYWDNLWAPRYPASQDRLRGYQIAIQFQPVEGPGQVLFHLFLDGPSGSIIEVDLPSSRLPV